MHAAGSAALEREFLDKIKALGFKYSTQASITVAVCDATIPPQKKDILAEADKKIDVITKQYATPRKQTPAVL